MTNARFSQMKNISTQDKNPQKSTKKYSKESKDSSQKSTSGKIYPQHSPSGKSTPKTAVVLLNMGGPTDIAGVEPFLKNIFGDPLLLPIRNSLVRKMVGSIIVSKRLESVKENYRKIGGCSPLIKHTFALTNALNALDSSKIYTYAMRYTPPFCQEVLSDLQARGVEDLVLFSLYPQFSTATAYSSFLDAKRGLKALEYAPRVSVVEHFSDYVPFYEFIVDEIVATLQKNNAQKPSEFVLLLSAHGLPQSLIDKGDCYVEHCENGKRIISQILESRGVRFANILLCYQSKVGPMRWIEPSTSNTITANKDSKIIIYPLAFSIDNSETDYELKIQYKELADSLKISDYLVCECPNDKEGFAKIIIDLANDALKKHATQQISPATARKKSKFLQIKNLSKKNASKTYKESNNKKSNAKSKSHKSKINKQNKQDKKATKSHKIKPTNKGK